MLAELGNWLLNTEDGLHFLMWAVPVTVAVLYAISKLRRK